MDTYAFYVTTEDMRIWQWIPFLVASEEDGIALRDENGNFIEDPHRIEAYLLQPEGSDTSGFSIKQKMHQ
jgi:hypothetical protein